MRVYVPNKSEGVINDVLRELYMLRESIEHDTGTVESKKTMIDNIRDKLRVLLEPTK